MKHAVLGARVSGVTARKLETTSAGGNVQVQIEGGNRIVAWKGDAMYASLVRLREGDKIDFTYVSTVPQEFIATQSGDTVRYEEYKGVELLGKGELENEGIVKGQAEKVPSELEDRDPVEEVQPKPKKEKTADVPQETGSQTEEEGEGPPL